MPLLERVRNLARLLRGGDRAPRVTPEEAKRLQEAGAVVVDVRQRGEWRRGRIAGAVNVPLADVESRLADIPRDRPVVVHCALGSRSALAAKRLKALGFEDVHDLGGGIQAWKRAGLPIEREE